MKLEFSRQFFEKYSNIKPTYSMRSDGRTDRHDEANSRFSKLCESAQNLNKQERLGLERDARY